MHQQRNNYIPPRIDTLELFAESNVMLTQSSFDFKTKTELIDWDTAIEL